MTGYASSFYIEMTATKVRIESLFIEIRTIPRTDGRLILFHDRGLPDKTWSLPAHPGLVCMQIATHFATTLRQPHTHIPLRAPRLIPTSWFNSTLMSFRES